MNFYEFEKIFKEKEKEININIPDEKVEKFTGGKVFSHVTIFEGICKDCLNEEDTSNGIKGFKNRKEFK